MTAKPYGQPPAQATISPEPFEISIPEPKLKLMNDLISLSPIGPLTYENSGLDTNDYGITRSWLSQAKDIWTTTFDWRASEKRINSFPHFTVPIRDTKSGIEVKVHFVALFSRKPDAIPLAMYHGWPGSFLEHLNVLELLRTRYTPETLPYHVVVPSLTGFTFSGGPPVDRDYDIDVEIRVLDALMTGLFGKAGYLAHGGDIGHTIALGQASRCEGCLGTHINNVGMMAPDNADELEMSALESKVVGKRQDFMKTGIAYALEHGTKPATIGLALSASPLALLAWIGEKYLSWTDKDPPVERILEAVSLYYLTDTFPRSIYNYRTFINRGFKAWTTISKPVGYSFFPQDLAPVPVSWLKTFANVVWHREHQQGGHFPGFEEPEKLLDDIEEFVSIAWKA